MIFNNDNPEQQSSPRVKTFIDPEHHCELPLISSTRQKPMDEYDNTGNHIVQCTERTKIQFGSQGGQTDNLTLPHDFTRTVHPLYDLNQIR